MVSDLFKKSVQALICLAILTMAIFSAQAQTGNSVAESKFYKIIKVNIPEEVILEVGGLAFNEMGQLAASTRRGEIWLITNPESEKPTFKRFAHGLHEVLGLAYRDGAFYFTQRGELNKVRDLNNDGKADSYETIYSWPLAANYHEYSYGPVFMPDGNMIVTLNLGWIGRGASLSKWRGWMLEITPEGEMTPLATGMRSPAGFGINAAGDIFYTENQGDWVGSGRMTHIEKGDFVGHPEGLKWTGEDASPLTLKMDDIVDTLGLSLYENDLVKNPSVWFPHGLMGISTSDILLIDHDNFGPFKDQLLVGDQGHSKIMRVYQEKVNGIYQGACFPFREGFSSGVLRLTWSPDQKSIFIGMTSRGWGSTGPDLFGLERLEWNGETPFEIKQINAKPDGFELTFTQPVDQVSGEASDSYSVSDFTYLYHHTYGSPAVDIQKKQIYDIELSEDRTKVRLFIDDLRPGYIYELKAPGVTNRNNQKLLHDFGYYTLNNIPEGEKRINHDAAVQAANDSSATTSKKHVTEMPGSWINGPDQTITLKSVPGLKFDIENIRVKVGSKIKLEFNNPDDMLHNLLILKPGTADKIVQLALDLGLKGQGMSYVPDTDDVLWHTTLLQPENSEVIYFEAPTIPGDYVYICTFPGHGLTMRGILTVTE